MKYPNNVKALRYSNGIYKQTDLAKRIGVTKQTVHNWEYGSVKISSVSLIKLTELFHCTVADIVANPSQKNDPTV